MHAAARRLGPDRVEGTEEGVMATIQAQRGPLGRADRAGQSLAEPARRGGAPAGAGGAVGDPGRRVRSSLAYAAAPGGACGRPARVGSRSGAPAGYRPGPLYLTRRGRVVALLVFLTAVLVAFSLGRAAHAAVLQRRVEHPARTVVLTPGETLWDVAMQAAPSQDPRVVVAELEAINHLRGPLVQAGQQLTLPASS